MAVSQYKKCNQVPPVISSKDRLIKEPKDFTCNVILIPIFCRCIVCGMNIREYRIGNQEWTTKRHRQHSKHTFNLSYFECKHSICAINV